MPVKMCSSGNSQIAGEMRNVWPLWNTVGQVFCLFGLVWFLQNYDLAIVIFGIYPKELKTYVHKNTCTQMFMSALLITAKTWK